MCIKHEKGRTLVVFQLIKGGIDGLAIFRLPLKEELCGKMIGKYSNSKFNILK